MKKFLKEYYWIAGIPLFILGFILYNDQEEDISKNKTETYGMVYGSTSIIKKYSKRNYEYKFYYDGKEYTGTSTAYITDKIRNGNFYKVEFSYKNPENSRMIFDVEYELRINTTKNGNDSDTIYVPKDQELRALMNEKMEKLKFKTDSLVN